MNIHEWRRQLDRISEIKSQLTAINPAHNEQTDRIVRHLQDVFAVLTKTDSELSTASMLKKRKLQQTFERVNGELEQDYMKAVRDLADLLRREHRDFVTLIPRLKEMRPEAASVDIINFPSIAAGDAQDAQALSEFANAFSKRYVMIRQDIARDIKTLLDENKRILETYEKHVTIDRGKVAATVSNNDVSNKTLQDLLLLGATLRTERQYLDSRKDEVSRMLSAALISNIESLQTSVGTATRLGLDLPIDFTQKLRSLAREASSATDLTTLIALESQVHTATEQMISILKDKIINMKHEVTQKIVAGGIPTTSNIIPTAPVMAVENMDLPMLLASYSKMMEWAGQVRLALRDQVEEIIDELQVATDAPDDTGIRDVVAARQFIADARAALPKGEIDTMVQLYLKARDMRDSAKAHIIEKIKTYLARFNELATSADRVLDYAQLSKKAPRVEELEGGIVFLLQSLGSLRGAVESGVATFRNACLQEIEAIIEDLQTIKPIYAEIFMPIIVELEDSTDRLKRLDEFGAIRLEMKNIKDGILVKSKEAVENLRYRLGVKIRLAAAKLLGAGVEIPTEVQQGISELNSIGVAAETVFSLPAIARRMIELYEQKISAKVIALLQSETTKLHKSLMQAAKIGVEVSREIAVLEEILSSPPQELEGAAEAFDRLMALTTSQTLHANIRSRVQQSYTQLKGALGLFEAQGMSEFVSRLKALIEQVPAKIEHEAKHIYEVLDVCLTLASIQEEMITVIKGMANKDRESHEKTLRERSKYYSTIERVYTRHPKDFSRLIYDIEKMKSLEDALSQAKYLDEALRYFNELKAMRKAWVERAERMDEWHKSLRMFLTGYSPTAPADVREKFLEEATKKIRETYSREDISSYMTWALREIAQSMSGREA